MAAAAFQAPENEVEADNGFRLRCLAAVKDGGLSLRPHEATIIGQEAVVAGGHLAFGQHCRQTDRGQS